ncbi:MAG: YjiH family protein [Lawsonibacter sp.]
MQSQTKSSGLVTLRFIVYSLIGVFMFFVPITVNGGTTIPIEYAIDTLLNHFTEAGRIYALAVMVVASVLPFAKKTWNKDKTTIVFSFSKIVGLIFGVLVYFEIAPEQVMRPDHGPFLFDSLAVEVGTLIPVAAIFLTFLMNYGFVDFVGQLLRKVMRTVWTTPGYSAVDAVASFMGSTAAGMLITNEMYVTRRYNTREASIIATGFSTVCISFFVVVAKTADIMHLWTQFFFVAFFTTFAITAVVARIYPLSKKPDTYYQDLPAHVETKIEGNLIVGAWKEGVRVCGSAGSLGTNVLHTLKSSFALVLEVVPNFMSIGLIALLLADYTPVFDWIGYIFYPLTALLQIPEALLAAKAAMLGLAEMFLPVLVVGGASETTRFIVAVISIVQVLMFSTTIPCVVATEIPVSIPEMVLIWFERTVLALLIVVPITYLIL